MNDHIRGSYKRDELPKHNHYNQQNPASDEYEDENFEDDEEDYDQSEDRYHQPSGSQDIRKSQ